MRIFLCLFISLVLTGCSFETKKEGIVVDYGVQKEFVLSKNHRHGDFSLKTNIYTDVQLKNGSMVRLPYRVGTKVGDKVFVKIE